MSEADRLLDLAKTASRESKALDFKDRFDPNSAAEWIELLKDVAAMANSGGGIIVIGAKNNGDASGADVGPILALDPAKVTDKVFAYTDEHFAGFEVHPLRRGGKKVAAIIIGAVGSPLVFSKPGTYATSEKDQKNAFSKGTVYFRHGAKSEPATGTDLARFIAREVDRVRKRWLGGIRRVVSAPPGAEIAVFQRAGSDDFGRPTKVRFTDDPGAPVFGKLDPDHDWPHRQKELIQEVNKRLPKKAVINPYDVQCVKAMYAINQKDSPQFAHLPKFGSLQYSDAFVDWLVTQHASNLKFFEETRARFYDRNRRR